MNVTVVIPAHNEADRIAATIHSIRQQTIPPHRIIVAADNCTDTTQQTAHACGAEVAPTLHNNHRKAGALNQTLRHILPALDPTDAILVMDADTTLHPQFLEHATAQLQDPTIGAVGGVFHGEPGGGLVGLLQRSEYIRYARELSRTRRVWVLTGTATLFRADTLRQVATERGHTLPGEPDLIYDVAALTEDNEITLAVKTLGWRCVSPDECRVVTEVMPTWRDLWRQRLRWQRGAIENLRAYGWTPVTRRYWRQQAIMAAGVVAVAAFLGFAALTAHAWSFHPFWTSLTLLFITERIVTVRAGGWRHMAAAAPLAIEFIYDLFLQVVLVAAVTAMLTRRAAVWHHVQP